MMVWLLAMMAMGAGALARIRIGCRCSASIGG